MAAWGPAWTYRFFGLITLAIGAVRPLPAMSSLGQLGLEINHVGLERYQEWAEDQWI